MKKIEYLLIINTSNMENRISGFDDKSDTVMTGFNTEELNEYHEKLLPDDQLQQKPRSKSVGNEAKTPFLRDTPTNSEVLDKIDEISDSQNSRNSKIEAEIRGDSPAVRLPRAEKNKTKSTPFGLNVK